MIATKGGLIRPGRDIWERNGDPAHLRQACEGSLKRLRLERIDLYQFHAPDPRVPLEDSVGELVKLQQEGKIRHIGVSNFSVAELERAARHREDRLGPESLQRQRPTIGRRGHLVRAAQDRVHSPLAAGGGRARSAARRSRHSPGCWPRSPVMLPIPGTSSVAHLEENVAAAGTSPA